MSRQTAHCPTCHIPVPGLLSGCRKPSCLRADLDAESTLDLNIEASES